jgi:ribosomal protein L22
MSPEKPTDEQASEGQEQAKPAAKAKPAAARKPPAKKPPAKKPPAKESAAKGDEPAAIEEKPATKPVAKKPAEKKPAEEKSSAPKAEKVAATKPEKPVAPKAEKVAASAAGDAQPAASTRARRKVVRAQARYVRTSARKARMVCGHLRGKSVPEARAILAFTPREVARDWSKLLESAVANAENNHELVEDDLLVREAYADEGPTIKRFRPRAQGRATPIRKRTSHLTITLTPKP